MSKVTLDSSKFTPAMKRISRGYRLMMLNSLATAVDRIRLRAAKQYVIPRSPEIDPRERRPYALRKLQKTDATRLTTRTGALVKMLTENAEPAGNKWKVGSKTMTLTTSAFKGMVKAVDINTTTEHYEATLKINITNVGAFSRSHSRTIKDIEGISRKTIVTPETSSTLAIRFKHDEPGIRGRKRQFITPASQDEHIPTRLIVDQKLSELARLA